MLHIRIFRLLTMAFALLGTMWSYASTTGSTDLYEEVVYVWTDDADSVCYLLAESPSVVMDGSDAVLMVAGREELRLTITASDHLHVAFGWREVLPSPTDTEQVLSSADSRVQKFILEGRVIIVRDGRWYDVEGRILK